LSGVTSGANVGISVAPANDDFDPELTVIGPDGATLVELDDGFSGEIETTSLTLPSNGAYTVRVTPFAFGGGAYAISVAGS
jgi:hypothetical protein